MNRQNTVKQRALSPERKNLHYRFNAWLQHPELESRCAALRAAMEEHELKDRLRRLLAPAESPRIAVVGLKGIPVEEVTFSNPEHRSTRLEFIADANHYGA